MRILMLGNSFTFANNMPAMLAELTGAEVVHHTRGGARLAEQLNPKTKNGAKTRAALENEFWDYVVLQEMSNGPITSRASFLKSAGRLCSWIREKGATPILFATWPYQRNNQAFSDLGISYEEMADGLYEAYHEAADQNGVPVADVGKKFCELADTLNLYAEDGQHPSEAGSRIAAETIAAVIKADQEGSGGPGSEGPQRFLVQINGLDVEAVFSRNAIEDIFRPFLRKLTKMQKEKGRRVLALLAAPPGAGKSTLLSFLEKLASEDDQSGEVQIIGMDGFHRRQAYLVSHTVIRDGREITMARIKGAPQTFDLEKLSERLQKVATGENCGWPIYDRRLHDPVDDVITVDGDIVLLEGNYLLLDEPGWRELRNFADYTVLIRADEELLRKRLVDRKAMGTATREEAEQFVEFSDLRNVRTCLEHSGGADLILRMIGDGEFEIE